MPIRWRLTLWFSLILLAILILSGVLLYSLLQSYLIKEVDNNLRVYSARVHGTLHLQEIPNPVDYQVIHSQLPTINEFASPGIYLQIINTYGTVTVKSLNLGTQELPVDPLLIEKGLQGNVDIETVPAGDNTRVRIMVSPLYLEDQTFLLEVAQSLRLVDATMMQVKGAILISVFIALALVGTSGAITVRRALSPVERITRTARSIEASADLARRVGYSGPADEIGQLATTFDHMIEHLGEVFESQKCFVADASHELRSPLTVIQGNLDLLKRNLSEEDRQESLKAIESETKRMTKIVSDLLFLAQVESGQLERQDQLSLKEILLEEFRRAQQLNKTHKIVIARQEDLTIKGDAHLLKQLLGNLVDNAIKYTPEGGTITLSLFRDGDWAILQVADTGVGIAPEHLPRIFDRFYRVDKARSRVRGGTGLGLTIVKEIAERHGGKVTVTSQPSKGSTFTVWLKL